MRTRLQDEKLSMLFRKPEMLKKEIKKENDTQLENFIYEGVTLQQHHYVDLIILKDNDRGSGVTYLTHQKRYLVLHKPPFKIKSRTDIKQFIKQPLHLTK